MATPSQRQLTKIIERLSKTVKESIDKRAMNAVGVFTTSLIVKRTRLGYGVTDFKAGKKKLAPLKASTIKRRSMFEGLAGTTRPKRSNLTMTGQMLESMAHKVTGPGSISIGPRGTRRDGKTNEQVAQYAHDGSANRPQRIFNRISKLEFNQVVRFYRKSFGDLLKKSNLIR